MKKGSNALYHIASQNSDLRGVSLLEASRIKAITADITRILKAYGKRVKVIHDKFGADDDVLKEKVDECRKDAMARIEAIIPHHCNDHSGCFHEECQVIRLQRQYINQFKAMNPGSQLTDEEIIKQHAAEIAKDHATKGRFKGKNMDMGEVGQAKVFGEISKRLDLKNIDRVAAARSSNRCENLFNVLAKFSHGKRLYQGRTNTWKVYQLFVAATINNDAEDVQRRIRERVGITHTSTIQQKETAKKAERKKYHKKVKKSAPAMERRQVHKMASTRKAVTNKQAPARHKPDKLSPKLDCKSNTNKENNSKAPAKRAPRRKRCSNCKTFHTGKCQEANNDNEESATNKKKKKQKKGEPSHDEIMAFLLSNRSSQR